MHMCIWLLISPLLCLNWWVKLIVKDRQQSAATLGLPQQGLSGWQTTKLQDKNNYC